MRLYSSCSRLLLTNLYFSIKNKFPFKMNELTNFIKVGSGTYGIVYSAKDSSITDYNGGIIAFKRNFKDPRHSGISNIRELDILSKLKGHPNIISLIKCRFDPVPLSPYMMIF